MNTYKTNIKDCYYSDHIIFDDKRGSFSEIYRSSPTIFKTAQINYSFSKKGVLRGIHRTPYAKYVTCVHGNVYDVCVDLRSNSQSYKQYFGINLNPSNLYSLYIPPYCGHVFLATEDSVLIYLQDEHYNAAFDETYCYKDYNIVFPENYEIIISDRDNSAC